MKRTDTHFLFFSKDINENVVLLDSSELAHISNVLRFCEGDEIQISDGKGNIFLCKIAKMKKDSALCEIISTKFCSEMDCEITLAVGLPDKDRFETLCEMLEPLGVRKIVPLITKNCQRNYLDSRWDKVLLRCERKIIASMKQSVNPYIMNVQNPVNLSEFVSNSTLNILADFDGVSMKEICVKEKSHKSVCIFVGPPTGFTQQEINLLGNSCVKLNLGKYRLRSELAATAAVCAFVQNLN